MILLTTFVAVSRQQRLLLRHLKSDLIRRQGATLLIYRLLGGNDVNKLLGTLALLVAIALPALAQQPGRLSPDDQREFDKYYTKWVNDTRKNDRDDIAKDVRE